MKGQWFVISAVMVSTAMLFLSILYRDYHVTDNFQVTSRNEDYYLESIAKGFSQTVTDFDTPNCRYLKDNLTEYIYFAKQKAAEKGYFLDLYYTITNANCTNRVIGLNLVMISSPKMQAWNGTRPEILSVVPSYSDNKLQTVTLTLKESVPYDLVLNMSIGDMLNTDLHKTDERIIQLGNTVAVFNFGNQNIDPRAYHKLYAVINNPVVFGQKSFLL